MSDVTYRASHFRAVEIEHRYGARVHLLDNPVGLAWLAKLASPECRQPELGRLVRRLYEHLAVVVLAAELPRERIDVASRMRTPTRPEAVYRGIAVDDSTQVVTAAIARAGTVPSQIVYETLNELLEPSGIRQDHLFLSRVTDAEGRVTGTTWHDAKIGKEVAGRIVLFPDPMGATGGSMSLAMNHYRTKLDGEPGALIAMNLIVTPEYIARVTQDHPHAKIYAFRLDRGLSPPDVLAGVPGTHWTRERGLNEHQYIVPGAGGLGELLNNAWV
ncbi:MAG: uracil phosphoribosyltransferase [Myxococcaceae bacterium]